MTRKILAVGVEIPGGEIEDVGHLSDRSLLDADIIIFSPAIPHGYYEDDTYLGKPCLSDDASFRAREAVAHWRRELAAAVEAGKLVVVLLVTPEIVYAGTGRKEYSGTGRNARATRIVEPLHAYAAIAAKWQFVPASGTEMTLSQEARFFAPYWAEFGGHSKYEVFLEGDEKAALVRTKAGNRVVGAYIRKGIGALLAVPNLKLDDESFFEVRKTDEKEETYWTNEATRFGKRFIATIVALADILKSEVAATPPPDWTRADAFRVPEEERLESEIKPLIERIASLEDERRGLESAREAAGSLRNLLFEQGKPLEGAVLKALTMFGFKAQRFEDDSSEFDAVFLSSEGRFIGEVEGKDNKAVNIEKFSQLERNLNEDFSKEGVEEFAKGVLFGNAFRLQPLESRNSPFTQKCITAAARLGVSLVSTPDLFEPARYLSAHLDPDYAQQCREVILQGAGTIVTFPAPPKGPTVEKIVRVASK